MENKGKKVFVALSGGVDSSVSAAILKDEGYDVTGVFMNVWQPGFIECEQGDSRREAMRVAAHLGIPFLTFDFEEEYKERVVDYMIAEYKKGRTPNPDVMCNKYIKFGLFFEKARQMGADYIATGHYARTNTEGQLLRGVDDNKDQTYFLWTLTHKELSCTLFPVGGFLKKEVRALAEKYRLPNAKRKESQGVCFLGEFDMKDFLSHYITPKGGSVLNEDEEIIGKHDGAFFLTCGQRHGFTITKKTPDDAPYYVIAKDMENNTITVSHKQNQEKHGEREVCIKEVNLIGDEPLEKEKIYHSRIRYRQHLQSCMVKKEKEGAYKVVFDESQIAVSRGQSLVLYDGERCCGGGII